MKDTTDNLYEYYDIIKDNFIDFQDDGYKISIVSAKRLIPTKQQTSDKYKIIKFSNITYREISFLEVKISGFINKSETYKFYKSESYLNTIKNAKEHLREIGLYLDIKDSCLHEISISNFIYRREDMKNNLNDIFCFYNKKLS